jgi:hypothetical protein
VKAVVLPSTLLLYVSRIANRLAFVSADDDTYHIFILRRTFPKGAALVEVPQCRRGNWDCDRMLDKHISSTDPTDTHILIYLGFVIQSITSLHDGPLRAEPYRDGSDSK